MNDRKTPRIRFKGYTDDWEQRKLGDFGEATGGTSIESEFSEEGIYKVINIGSYSEDSTYRDQGIRAKDSEKTRNRILNKGDLTMILNDKTASGNIIGRVLLIEQSGRYVYNQRTERIEIYNDKYDSIFLYEMLNAPDVRDKIIKQSQGNTQIYVNWSTISKTDYLVPKIEEQRRIGEFLQNLGILITLHQRKLEKLKIVKKAMLENCFPKNGEKVPKFRFSGFTGDWEQRKLSDLVERVVRKNNNNECSLPLTISAQDGLVDQIIYFNNRVASRDVSNYYLVLNGEFAYNKSTSDGFPFGAVKRLDLYEKGVLSTLYIVFGIKNKEKVNSDFLTVFFDTDRWHKGVAERAAEGARNHGLLNVSAEDFFDIDLHLPKQEAEQALIGAYMKHFDHLITLHQRKLEKLKIIKKSFLEKMFV